MNSFNYSVSYLYFIIIIFFLILTKFCYQVFKKFIIFFLLIILIGDGYSFFRSFVENFTYEEKIDLPNKNEVKNKRELDIIYIISDASLPFNRVFEKKKKIYYIKEFQKLGFKNFENSKSIYGTTSLTFTSMFRLNNDFIKFRNKDNDELTTLNIPSRYLYPSMLLKNQINQTLIKRLKLLDIEFNWIGNVYFNCKLFNLKNCLSKIESGNFFYLNILYKFFSDSLIDRPIVKNFYRKYSRKYLFENRDVSLNDLEKVIIEKKYKRNFNMVHHFLPHEPYIYNDVKKCDIIDDKVYPKPTDKKYYKIQYECNIINILQKIKKIIEKKPNSIIVLQGDHGALDYRGEILNLVKFPEICKRYFQKNMNNQLTIVKSILNCVNKENL